MYCIFILSSSQVLFIPYLALYTVEDFYSTKTYSVFLDVTICAQAPSVYIPLGCFNLVCVHVSSFCAMDLPTSSSGGNVSVPLTPVFPIWLVHTLNQQWQLFNQGTIVHSRHTNTPPSPWISYSASYTRQVCTTWKWIWLPLEDFHILIMLLCFLQSLITAKVYFYFLSQKKQLHWAVILLSGYCTMHR